MAARKTGIKKSQRGTKKPTSDNLVRRGKSSRAELTEDELKHVGGGSIGNIKWTDITLKRGIDS